MVLAICGIGVFALIAFDTAPYNRAWLQNHHETRGLRATDSSTRRQYGYHSDDWVQNDISAPGTGAASSRRPSESADSLLKRELRRTLLEWSSREEVTPAEASMLACSWGLDPSPVAADARTNADSTSSGGGAGFHHTLRVDGDGTIRPLKIVPFHAAFGAAQHDGYHKGQRLSLGIRPRVHIVCMYERCVASTHPQPSSTIVACYRRCRTSCSTARHGQL